MKKLCIALFLLAASGLCPAKEVIRIAFSDGALALHDTGTNCQTGRYEAFMLHADGSVRFNGCWRINERERTLHIIWDDGDETNLPVQRLLRSEI